MLINLQPKLLHICGPFWLNSYGLTLAISLSLFLLLSINDPRRKALITNTETYLELLFYGVLAGIIGSRLLFVLQELSYFKQHPLTVLAIWDGGLSLLGALITVPIFVILSLSKSKTRVLPFFDLITTYVPIIEVITRFGCLAAGCCHGAIAHSHTPITLIYTNVNSLAPLGVALYPTQIYAAGLALSSFAILYSLSKLKLADGTIMCIYFIMSGISRFSVDFWRGDRGVIDSEVSLYQFLALGFAAVGLAGVLFINWKNLRRK